jgi:hypothetical protein
MKGMYPTLSHSILLLLGLITMSLLIVAISSSLSNIETDLTTVELNFIADSAKSKVIEVYAFANQSSSYATGLFSLNLPDKVGNVKYSMTLQQNDLILTATVKNNIIEIVRPLAIDAELSGSSFMPASIKLDKQNGLIKIGLIQ